MSANGRLVSGDGATLIGNIITLTVGMKVTLRLNAQYAERDQRSPKYEVFSTGRHGEVRVGFAWEKTAEAGPNPGSKFLTMLIDDPSFDQPLNVTAFPSRTGDGYDIVWRRMRAPRDPQALGERAPADEELPR